MAEAATLVTADELLAMPDDGWRYELRAGELIRMSPTGAEHGDIAGEFLARLRPHVRERKLGRVFAAETGFRLFDNPDTVRAPDVSFVRAERIPPGRLPTGYWPGPPDLAVEVASPSDSAEDVNEKIAEYLRAGSRLVVVLYPRTRQVGLYRPDGSAQLLPDTGVLDLGDVVPGFACPIAELFDLT